MVDSSVRFEKTWKLNTSSENRVKAKLNMGIEPDVGNRNENECFKWVLKPKVADDSENGWLQTSSEIQSQKWWLRARIEGEK